MSEEWGVGGEGKGTQDPILQSFQIAVPPRSNFLHVYPTKNVPKSFSVRVSRVVDELTAPLQSTKKARGKLYSDKSGILR